MAALNTLALIGPVFRGTPRISVAREAAPRMRHRLALAPRVWAAFAPALACLWAVLALGFSLLVLVALILE